VYTAYIASLGVYNGVYASHLASLGVYVQGVPLASPTVTRFTVG